jgi:cytochrome c553
MNAHKVLAAGVAAWAAVAMAQAPAPPEVVVTKCSLCHGLKGESASEEFPRLAAQNEAYLAKQLGDFKAGRREGLMVRMVRGLPDEEIPVIARYFSGQSAPPAAATPPDIAAVGRYIHLHGNTWSGVPACRVCHGESAHGTPKLPRLAGQNVAYLEKQIREFTQRQRTNDNEIMHSVAEKLTALETRAVAEYLSGLP